MQKIAAWYQKKISSYDKAEWETLVEQMTVRGAYRRHVVDASANLPSSYLIDVDLVRGSSFWKAKPMVGMWRVLWLALVRLALLPALLGWWRKQTSPGCARLLLALWILQLLTVILYLLAPEELRAECDSVLVPLVLMIALSVVHAHIVSTTSLELGRKRARPKRKLPGYFRRARREPSADSPSAESAPTPAQSAKQAKFRRRPSLARGCSEEAKQGAVRKRRDINKTAMDDEPGPSRPVPNKARDSDDENSMYRRRPPTPGAPPSPESIYFPGNFHEYGDGPYRSRGLMASLFDNDDRFGAPLNLGEDDEMERINRDPSTISDEEVRASMQYARLFNYNNFKIIPFDYDSLPPHLRDAIPPDRENWVISQETMDSIIEESKIVSESVRQSFFKPPQINLNLNNPELGASYRMRDDESDRHYGDQAGSSNSRRGEVRFRNYRPNTGIEDDSSEDEPNANSPDPDDQHSSSSDGEGDTSAPSVGRPSQHNVSDWVGHTTNSEECSYSSQSEGSQSDGDCPAADSTWDPFSILNPARDTVKCLMWEKGDMMKAELSAVDISWCVVARAERAMATDGGYLWAGVAMATIVAMLPCIARLLQVALAENDKASEELGYWLLRLPKSLLCRSGHSLAAIAFGDNARVVIINMATCILRLVLSGLCFFLLGVAERAYKQRFLYAKLFSHLTSARRARKSELPHFRLHTVRNIKTWLSARSYLRRRGPQRSVDVIVSSAFVVTLSLLACVAAQLLRESETADSGWMVEVMVWCGCLGVYLLRLLTLGSNISRKYRACLSAIITEQINLHLAIEQRPDSKEQLVLANNVLKLAADLLKELDAPFKISGMCANHYLYTITKVVILSALSGVLSEMLGFKLKLHKIKIK